MTEVPEVEDMFRNRRRAESFGSVAAQYDRARPSYPDALVVDLLMPDPKDVLDVGCGTGKAARLFAAHGLAVLGVEPDAGMAAVARSHGVEVEVAPFETWDDRGRRFDLVISGQAWHWVEPAIGTRRAKGVLRAGGTLALFWNLNEVDPAARQQFDEVYAREAPQLAESRARHGGRPAGRDGIVEQLEHAGFDVETRDYAWQRAYSRDEFLDLLPTYSDHNLLAADQQARLLDGLGTVVDRLGGSITGGYGTHLIEARLAP